MWLRRRVYRGHFALRVCPACVPAPDISERALGRASLEISRTRHAFLCRRNCVAVLLGAVEELGTRVSIDERLTRLCADFSVAKIGEWLERKFASYDTSKQDVISIAENKNDKEYFRLFCKL